MENFLKAVFEYVIVNYGSDLELSGLRTIEIVEKLPGQSDGRMTDIHTILISSRLYNQLPILDINKLQGNDTFRMIINTLFHELCHINEIAVMPNIHQYSFSHKDTGFMIALFWIEYVVEKKTCDRICLHNNELNIDTAKNDWNISKLNFDEADCSNYFYLIKILSYVIARVRADNAMDLYLETFKNSVVKSMIYELNNEILQLEALYPFDNIETLIGIQQLFEKYWDYFNKRKPFVSALPD